MNVTRMGTYFFCTPSIRLLPVLPEASGFHRRLLGLLQPGCKQKEKADIQLSIQNRIFESTARQWF